MAARMGAAPVGPSLSRVTSPGWSRRTPNRLARRFQCGYPDPFRTVRDVGFVATHCSHPSGELQGHSSVWLPAWLPLPASPRSC
jgi:hypothetical protein